MCRRSSPSTPWDAQLDRIEDCLRKPFATATSVLGAAPDDGARSALHAAVLTGSLDAVTAALTALATQAAAAEATAAAEAAASVAAAINTEPLSQVSVVAEEAGAMAAPVAPEPAAASSASTQATASAPASKASAAIVATVSARDCNGVAPLLSAVALVTVWARVAAEGPEEETAEPGVVEEAVAKLVKALLSAGADPKTTDGQGNTPLHWAAFRGHASVVEALAAQPAGAHLLRLPNNRGETALHWASRIGAERVASVLVGLGASLRDRNDDNLSPLDVAGYGLLLTASEEGGEGDDSDGDRSDGESGGRDVGFPPLGWPERCAMRRCLFLADPRLRTLVVSHDDCLGHLPRSADDWECPERIAEIMAGVGDPARFDPHDGELEVTSDFAKAPAELLARAHSKEYIRFVTDLAKRMASMTDGDDGDGAMPRAVPFTPQVQRHMSAHKPDQARGERVKTASSCDTSFSAGSLNASRRAAGGVMTAVDRVLRGRNRNAFCVVRPPGHHAGVDGLLANASSHGFCIFNSVAAGALHALEAPEHRCRRVAIIDIDVHHGNGTEEIVRRYDHPDRLLFFSIHLFDKEKKDKEKEAFEFYPGSGAGDHTAKNIINVPLMPLWRLAGSGLSQGHEKDRAQTRGRSRREGDDSDDGSGGAGVTAATSGRRAFRNAIGARLVPSLRAFNPELILLSTGFDAVASDVGNSRMAPRAGALGGIDLAPDDFFWVTKEIQAVRGGEGRSAVLSGTARVLGSRRSALRSCSACEQWCAPFAALAAQNSLLSPLVLSARSRTCAAAGVWSPCSRAATAAAARARTPSTSPNPEPSVTASHRRSKTWPRASAWRRRTRATHSTG